VASRASRATSGETGAKYAAGKIIGWPEVRKFETEEGVMTEAIAAGLSIRAGLPTSNLVRMYDKGFGRLQALLIDELAVDPLIGFLTEEDVFTLTKRKYASARIRVLKKQGISFKLDGNGDPVVAWASVIAVSGRIPKKAEPNVEALQRLMDSQKKRKQASSP
jgi:hypothetical protein